MDSRDIDAVPASQTLVSRLFRHRQLTFSILSITLRRIGDTNVLPHVNIILAFLWCVANIEQGLKFLGKSVPWFQLAIFLTSIAKSVEMHSRIESPDFLKPEKGDRQPLPEDYMLRGQVWSTKYFPDNYWTAEAVPDEDERSISMEPASVGRMRAERVLWLGVRLASLHVEKMPVKLICHASPLSMLTLI